MFTTKWTYLQLRAFDGSHKLDLLKKERMLHDSAVACSSKTGKQELFAYRFLHSFSLITCLSAKLNDVVGLTDLDHGVGA